MGVKQVVRNIGNGRLFGHNRFFGVHNPLDYDIRKARDPFINLRTLVKLSRCPDPCVRQQVSKNLASRLDRLDPKVLSRFDREMVIDALSLTDKIFYPLDPRSSIARLVNEATPEELGKLLQSPSYGILALLISNPDVPKSTKLEVVSLSITNKSYDTLASAAYRDLKENLTPEELHLFADSIIGSKPHSGAIASFRVLSDIVQHPETFRETLLKLASVHSVNFVHAGFHSNIGDIAYSRLNETTLTKDELKMLAGSSNKTVLEGVGKHIKTPGDVRLELASKGVESACAAAEEFTMSQLGRIVNALIKKHGETQVLSNRPTPSLLYLAENRRTSSKLVAKILSEITPKTREVVDKEPTYKTGTYEDYAANGGDPATGPCALPQVVDEPGEYHHEYSESGLNLANRILTERNDDKEKILKELQKINPELASALRQ